MCFSLKGKEYLGHLEKFKQLIFFQYSDSSIRISTDFGPRVVVDKVIYVSQIVSSLLKELTGCRF